MTKEEKAALVEELAEQIREHGNFYVLDVSRLNSADTNAFRRKCFENNIKLRVVKNTLIKKAFAKIGVDYSSLDPALKQASSLLFVDEKSKAAAQLILDFRKDRPDPVFKGAYVEESVFLGEDSLKALKTLKTKNELIGEVIGLLQSPTQNVLGALQSGGHKIAGLVKTLQERGQNAAA